MFNDPDRPAFKASIGEACAGCGDGVDWMMLERVVL
jgi:hypothetical protein